MSELQRQDGGAQVQPRLWRSMSNRVVAGVLGGLAERLGMDVTLTRVLYVLFSIMSGFVPGVFIYGLMWFIIPARND